MEEKRNDEEAMSCSQELASDYQMCQCVENLHGDCYLALKDVPDGELDAACAHNRSRADQPRTAKTSPGHVGYGWGKNKDMDKADENPNREFGMVDFPAKEVVTVP